MRPPKIRDDIRYEPLRYVINDIFPTPLLRGEMQGINDDVVRDSIALIDEIKQFESDPLRNYTTYFFQEQRLKMEELPWYRIFANTIKDTYIDYVKNQFGRRVSHLNRHNIHLFAWTSVWTEGIYHKYHSHQDSIVSGTYYPINEGGQGIKFQSPAYHSAWIHTTKPETGESDFPNALGVGQPGSLTEMIYTPVDGEVLMWPSNLLHTVEPRDETSHANKDFSEDYKRVAISFNLKHNEPIDNTEHGDDLSYEFLQS